ncbi:MAG: SDR family oxidoreductase, partial [Chloroflexota bacterium]
QFSVLRRREGQTSTMDMGIKNRVAIVAASSKGIGKAVAMGLAAEGARVAMFSRDQASIDAAADEVRGATGAEVLALAADVTKVDDIQRVVDQSLARWGRIDILFNNAGGPPPGLFESFDDEAWQRAFELNLLSSVRLYRAVLPTMKERRWGRLLSLTSSSVKQPIENLILSNGIRPGVVGLSKTLANEISKIGITVNVLAPGRIATERLNHTDAANAERTGKTLEEVRAASVAAIPMGRLGTPEELANMAVFLCSEKASYVTGQVIFVDGGSVKSV